MEKLGLDKQQSFSDIKKLIKRHNQLFCLGAKLESIFSSTNGFYLAQSSLVLCLVLLRLSRESDVTAITIYAPAGFSILNQILVFCYLGQKIRDASLSVAESVWNCNWTHFKDPCIQRALLMMLMRSQKPQVLTAQKFQVISLESFTTVLSFQDRFLKFCNLFPFRLWQQCFPISHYSESLPRNRCMYSSICNYLTD